MSAEVHFFPGVRIAKPKEKAMTDDLRGLETRLDRSLQDLDIRLGVLAQQQRNVVTSLETLVANIDRLVDVMERIGTALDKIEGAASGIKIEESSI